MEAKIDTILRRLRTYALEGQSQVEGEPFKKRLS